MWHRWPYSQHLIFFETYGPNKLEGCITLGRRVLTRDKHSSLLGPFVSKKWSAVIMAPEEQGLDRECITWTSEHKFNTEFDVTGWAQYLPGEILKVVWADSSTLS